MRSSLLNLVEGERFFSRGIVLAFELAGAPSRVQRARSLLRDEGLTDVVAARSRFRLPAGRWLCRPYLDGEIHDNTPEMEMGFVGGFAFTEDDGRRPTTLPQLHVALMLGLCGPSYYSADRSVIWSESRLGRRLALFRADNFYDGAL